jgi:hypothetical protein
MTTLPITATPTRTLGGCLLCAAGQFHTRHDVALPAVERTTITAAPIRKSATR